MSENNTKKSFFDRKRLQYIEAPLTCSWLIVIDDDQGIDYNWRWPENTFFLKMTGEYIFIEDDRRIDYK